MEEAAENLGCTGFRKFRRITLPLIMPGLFAGGTIVFIFAFTELGVPLIFDLARVTSVQIFYGIKEIAGNPFPFALVAVMLASTALLYAASKLLFGRANHAMVSKATTVSSARTPGIVARWACALGFAAITAARAAAAPRRDPRLGRGRLVPHRAAHAAGPSSTTAPRSATRSTVPSILNSLKYASLATVFDLVLGVLIAYVVVRTTLPGPRPARCRSPCCRSPCRASSSPLATSR